MYLFIASEIMLFGSFFTAYFFVRIVNGVPWPIADELLDAMAERGDTKSARAWYQTAVDDRDPDVAAAARAGLVPSPR